MTGTIYNTTPYNKTCGIVEWATWINEIAAECEQFAADRNAPADEAEAYVEGVRRGMREAMSVLTRHDYVGPLDLDR